MSFKILQIKNKISILGQFSGQDVGQLTEAIERIVQGPITIDLSKISFIDSSGLGVLIYNWKNLKEKSREMTLTQPNDVVYEIFKNSNLDKILRIK